MLRRYSLAVVGAVLMATLLVAIARVAPWTLTIAEPANSYGADIINHKLIGVVGFLIVAALVGFMALGERLGLIKPPKSDVITLFKGTVTTRDDGVASAERSPRPPRAR
jgi:hypothetical protein